MRRPNLGFGIALQATSAGGGVPIVRGKPGGGKTSWTASLSAKAMRRMIAIILGNKRPEDIGGYPRPAGITMSDGTVVDGLQLLYPEDMCRVQFENCLVLMDEINQAGDDVLAAAQEWLRNPPRNAWFCGAMNPVECSTNGRELSPPVVNRCVILDWQPVRESRRIGWRNGFRNYPASDIPLLPPDFLDHLGSAWGDIMCDFEDAHMDLFGDDAFPKDVNQAVNPFPSDRSWTNVGILMAACDAVGAGNDTKAELATGCVGGPAAQQFMQFLLHRGLPDFEQLLALPNTLQLPAGNYPIARATLAGVVGRVIDENTPLRWEAACDVFERAFEQQPETAVSVVGELFRAKPRGHMPAQRNGSWKELQDVILSQSHK